MRFDELFASREWCDEKWVCSLHCEQASPREQWERRNLRCPTPGCNGDALDAFRWEALREDKPELPEVPAVGELYRMSG